MVKDGLLWGKRHPITTQYMPFIMISYATQRRLPHHMLKTFIIHSA